MSTRLNYSLLRNCLENIIWYSRSKAVVNLETFLNEWQNNFWNDEYMNFIYFNEQLPVGLLAQLMVRAQHPVMYRRGHDSISAFKTIIAFGFGLIIEDYWGSLKVLPASAYNVFLWIHYYPSGFIQP